MLSRQQQLLIGLAAVVVLWIGNSWLDAWLFEPLRQLRTNVTSRQETVDTKTLQVIAIEQAKAKLKAWQTRSLAPDPGKKARPTATEALRQYTEWVTELAHSVALDEVTVAPQRQAASRNGVYVEVVVQIEGEGRYSQFLELLERFYHADVLQRIGRLQITSLDVLGDPPVKFTLETGALALADTPPLRAMFPRTTLASGLSAEATTFDVVSSMDFPKKVPFRVRIERELLEVTVVIQNTWTVTRGVDRTEAAEHDARSTISLVKLLPKQPDISRVEFRQLVAENIFVKPTPPVPYEFKFGPFTPPLVIRGKTWDFSISAKDFDPARGEPTYAFVGKPPAGLSLKSASGQMSWKLDTATPAGDYPVEVEVRHPSAPSGRSVEKITLTVAEPNTAPKLERVNRLTAYRGQPLRLQVTATDADLPAQKLTYKLGSGAPESANVDAKTGELTWTLPENYPVGSTTLAVVVTDSGTPPQSATLNLTVNVKDDVAKSTELVGIIGVGDKREAWLVDKTANKKTIVQIGDEFQAANVSGKVIDLDLDSMTVELDGETRTLKLGQTVRSLVKRD